jgi:hypothetical protein
LIRYRYRVPAINFRLIDVDWTKMSKSAL